MSSEIEKIQELVAFLTDDEKREIDSLLTVDAPMWVPLPGPQSEAYYSGADVLLYGGAAGGGKTDLAVGLTLTKHTRSIIFRREGTQLQAIIDRVTDILGSRDGFNGQDRIWRLPRRQVEFGSVKDPGDEVKYQGRPHDLIVFDEVPHFQEMQVRFLMGWLRTTQAGQRSRVLMTGNPPTDSDGEWIIRFFAPWLDREHPNPALPGELRWYSMVDGVEVERVDGAPFVHKGKEIRPKSRTFIPSRVSDNPFLTATDYEATLQALPEPLRSQLLNGDFLAGREEDPWQVIPAAWVEEAQKRWKEDGRKGPMDSVGVDVARGGKDQTVISTRYGTWFSPLVRIPGTETPDGPSAAARAVVEMRNGAPLHVDVIGVGGSVYDHLVGNQLHVVGVNWAQAADKHSTDRSGKIRFVNQRAQDWWALREGLDPVAGEQLALPPDPALKADLCSAKWKLTARGIQIEAKEDIRTRLKRSPDGADAVVLAFRKTPMRDEGGGQIYAETDCNPLRGRSRGQLEADTQHSAWGRRR